MTIDEFNLFANGDVIGLGIRLNSPKPNGLYMTDNNFNDPIKWIAIKGHNNDWCIYIHWNTSSWNYVKTNGDKITGEHNIKKLMKPDKKMYKLYRY